jgi:hypothetical protein
VSLSGYLSTDAPSPECVLKLLERAPVTFRHPDREGEPQAWITVGERRPFRGDPEAALAGHEAGQSPRRGALSIRENLSGAREIRTPDLFHAMEALYHLSYGPVGIVDSTGLDSLGKIIADRTHDRNGTQGV